MNTLWQRFGRAARDPSLDAVAILFVEAKYFDDEKEKKTRAQKRKAEQELERQRKKTRTLGAASEPSHSCGHGDTQQVLSAPSEVSRSTGGGVESRADATAARQSRGLSQERPSAVDDAGAIAGAQVRRLADVAALRADFQAAYVSTRSARRGKKKAGPEEELSPELDALSWAQSVWP